MKPNPTDTTYRLERLSPRNFKDYERITSTEGEAGGCYCAFWHQKWASMEDWLNQCKTTPEKNRDCVSERMRSGFHVGALVYDPSSPEAIGWISIAPITEFHWTWRRVAARGEDSKNVAGITCFTIDPKHRKTGLSKGILNSLQRYAAEQGWAEIEAYPFDDSAVEKHGEKVYWPGLKSAYVEAGFTRTGDHWIQHPDWARSIYGWKVDRSMATRLYYNPACSKCREAESILNARGIAFRKIEYLRERPTEAELREVLRALKLRPREIVRTGDELFESLNQANPIALDDDAHVIALLVANPSLIERPIFLKDGKAVVARPPSKLEQLLY